MSIGVAGNTCLQPELELQTTVYGRPSQQFTLEGKKMISVMCPGFEISSPANCEGPLQFLEKSQGIDEEWQFDPSTHTIQSLNCPNKFITIDSASDNLRNQYSRVLPAATPNFVGKDVYADLTSSTCDICSATLYDKGGYGGRSDTYTPATSGDNIPAGWFSGVHDNAASSIKVDGGSSCRATVY
jgi:hypothetical protein